MRQLEATRSCVILPEKLDIAEENGEQKHRTGSIVCVPKEILDFRTTIPHAEGTS
jgi:hypothetical protein